uniref:RNase H type-1 domain-containing protein n=1 Tax=Triticum urartu TaxID=4572 RepID=A0A8R7TS11_TRIUA
LNGAVGAVLRDDRGGFIAASNEKLEHVADVATAEAFALRHGFLLAQQVGVNKLVVEADCLEVINTINLGGFTATGAAAIYVDCNILIIGYTSVSFVHCHREANCVSHELARLAVSNSPSLWVEEPPASIVRWLVEDIMVI